MVLFSAEIRRRRIVWRSKLSNKEKPFDTRTPLQKALQAVEGASPEDMVQMSESDLRKLPGMTNEGIEFIKNVLSKHNLTLRGEKGTVVA